MPMTYESAFYTSCTWGCRENYVHNTCTSKRLRELDGGGVKTKREWRTQETIAINREGSKWRCGFWTEREIWWGLLNRRKARWPQAARRTRTRWAPCIASGRRGAAASASGPTRRRESRSRAPPSRTSALSARDSPRAHWPRRSRAAPPRAPTVSAPDVPSGRIYRCAADPTRTHLHLPLLLCWTALSLSSVWTESASFSSHEFISIQARHHIFLWWEFVYDYWTSISSSDKWFPRCSSSSGLLTRSSDAVVSNSRRQSEFFSCWCFVLWTLLPQILVVWDKQPQARFILFMR